MAREVELADGAGAAAAQAELSLPLQGGPAEGMISRNSSGKHAGHTSGPSTPASRASAKVRRSVHGGTSATEEILMGLTDTLRKAFKGGVTGASAQLRTLEDEEDDGLAQIRIPLETVPYGQGIELTAKGLPQRVDELGLCRRSLWARLEKVSKFNRAMWEMRPDLRDYYQTLYTTVDTFRAADGQAEEEHEEPEFVWIIYLSFAANVLIFAVKVVAAISSGSLVVFASAMDSFLDLLAGSILAFSASLMSSRDRYTYPVGKKRMEGLAVIFMAAVMLTSYVQVIITAAQRFVAPVPVELDAFSLGILISVVFVKGVLYSICQATLKTLTLKAVSLEAQAADHFNDCVTNFFSAVGALLASPVSARLLGLADDTLVWIDPFVAIMFSIYVIAVWAGVAKENMEALVGVSAPALLMQTVSYLSLVHCSEIQALERVVVYSHGTQYIAEVTIVLPRGMPNERSHLIASALQTRLETLGDVDRCFVHVDFEVGTSPEPMEDV